MLFGCFYIFTNLLYTFVLAFGKSQTRFFLRSLLHKLNPSVISLAFGSVIRIHWH